MLKTTVCKWATADGCIISSINTYGTLAGQLASQGPQAGKHAFKKTAYHFYKDVWSSLYDAQKQLERGRSLETGRGQRLLQVVLEPNAPAPQGHDETAPNQRPTNAKEEGDDEWGDFVSAAPISSRCSDAAPAPKGDSVQQQPCLPPLRIQRSAEAPDDLLTPPAGKEPRPSVLSQSPSPSASSSPSRDRCPSASQPPPRPPRDPSPRICAPTTRGDPKASTPSRKFINLFRRESMNGSGGGSDRRRSLSPARGQRHSDLGMLHQPQPQPQPQRYQPQSLQRVSTSPTWRVASRKSLDRDLDAAAACDTPTRTAPLPFLDRMRSRGHSLSGAVSQLTMHAPPRTGQDPPPRSRSSSGSAQEKGWMMPAAPTPPPQQAAQSPQAAVAMAPAAAAEPAAPQQQSSTPRDARHSLTCCVSMHRRLYDKLSQAQAAEGASEVSQPLPASPSDRRSSEGSAGRRSPGTSRAVSIGGGSVAGGLAGLLEDNDGQVSCVVTISPGALAMLQHAQALLAASLREQQAQQAAAAAAAASAAKPPLLQQQPQRDGTTTAPGGPAVVEAVGRAPAGGDLPVGMRGGGEEAGGLPADPACADRRRHPSPSVSFNSMGPAARGGIAAIPEGSAFECSAFAVPVASESAVAFDDEGGEGGGGACASSSSPCALPAGGPRFSRMASLKRLPSRAREAEGDKTQEGISRAEVMRDEGRVALQAALSGRWGW